MSTKAFRSIKPLFISITGIVIILGFLFFWKSIRSKPLTKAVKPPMLVSALRVQSRSVPAELQAIGSLQAVQEVLLAPDTAGRITGIHFEAGKIVKEGTILLQLYDAPEQADRAAAIAKADFARVQMSRLAKLALVDAAPRSAFDQNKAEYDQAIAAVRQLDARIQQKTIRAPFTGQIGIRRVNMGQYLNAGDPIATLTKLDPLYVNFTVPQQELPKLKPDGKVMVTVDTSPGRVFIANINSIEPRINGATRNIAVQCLLLNADRQLKSGMYVNVRVQLPEIADAITVPLTAIQTSSSGDSVVVVQEPNAEGIGKSLAVPVKTGRRLGGDVIVEQGLKSGDVVVTAGQIRIPPGAPVKISAPSLSQSDAPDSAPTQQGK